MLSRMNADVVLEGPVGNKYLNVLMYTEKYAGTNDWHVSERRDSNAATIMQRALYIKASSIH